MMTLPSFNPPESHEQWYHLFLRACSQSDLEVVRTLCHREFIPIANIHSHGEYAFQEACSHGALPIVQFLTTSPELLRSGHTFVNVHTNHDLAFQWACKKGHLDVVKFLTTSPDLLACGHTFVNIHSQNTRGLQEACAHGHLDVVKFLTTSVDLIACGHSLPDAHDHYEYGFQWACDRGHWHVLEFLIFELRIQKTPSLEAIIKDFPQAQAYFQARDQHEQLQQTLHSSRPSISQNHSIDSLAPPHCRRI